MSEARALEFPVVSRTSSERPAWVDAEATGVRPVTFARAGVPKRPAPASGAPDAPRRPASEPDAAAEPATESGGSSAPGGAPSGSPAPSAPGADAPSGDPRAALAKLEAELNARVEAELDAARAELDAMRASLENERAALEGARERFVDAASALAQARTEAVVEAEGPLLELAVGIAQALVEGALEEDPELHVRMARTALSVLGESGGTELRASREAHQAIVEANGAPVVRFGGVEVPVVPDASLDGLGCIAEKGRARVDGRLGERLKAVQEALSHERRRSGEEGR
ncbi:MAG TPA: FliH/SctL family protein [Sandaracinaceae bacterium LLY-WYZ-13_1]|nr:FliH/SctL family protein [Sandaracinaceae bacterium LLY-WYZ-13_1]